jgi:2-polyprenyl-3-methyl-5-hydroxy-6-metoxy-1,4-benzoquinol methylase
MTVSDLKPGVIKECQICRSKKIYEILNLGHSGLCDSLLKKEDLNKHEKSYPLKLFKCRKCHLLQINYVVNNEEVFHLEYPYKSGITKTLKDLLHSTSKYSVDNFKFSKKPLAIDIGSNDGTLLEGFKNHGFNVLGIEPTNIAKLANKKGIKTIQKFFDYKTAQFIKKKYHKAEVITGTNIFAHINKLDSLMKGVKNLLNPDNGIFVSESHYAVNILDEMQFDSIYHEHLRFYLLKPLIFLLNKYGFNVIDASRIPNYAGSIRVTATLNKKIKPNKNIKQILDMEEKEGFYSEKKYKQYAKKVIKVRKDLNEMLWKLKLNKKKIVGVGCPGRSITLLSYCNISNQLIDYIAEQNSSLKLNMFTPSTHIEIIDEKHMIKKQPDYALILSWHYGKNVMKNLRNKGFKGKFIMPLPKPRIIN